MVKIVIYGKQDKPINKIVYTGDFNFDNKAMMDETEKQLLDVDTLITDTTNIRPNAYKKPSVQVTREIMEESITKALKNSEKSAIFETAWHNVKDLALLQGIAASMGVDVYVYPKMAILLYLLHQLDETRQKSVQNYNWRQYDPVPRLDADVLPWMKGKMSYTKGEKLLRDSMDVATHASLAKASRHILVVPPNPSLYTSMLNADIRIYEQIIRDHYWPYGKVDKDIVRSNYAFARTNNLRYLTDLYLRGGNVFSSENPRFHISGHAKPEDSLALMKRMAEQGILKVVLPIHGDARGYAAQEIRAQSNRLKVYDRYSKNGFTVSLYNKNN